jgi:hypothetical protein
MDILIFSGYKKMKEHTQPTLDACPITQIKTRH